MEDKDILIEEYVKDKAFQLKSSGMFVNSNQINSVINRFSSSSDEIDVIKREIDELVEEFVENFNKMKEKLKMLKDEYKPEVEDGVIYKAASKISLMDLPDDVIEERFNNLENKMIEDRKNEELNERIKNGTAESNISEVKGAIKTIFTDEVLSDKLYIYGSTIPYLLTGENPLRNLGDIDTHVDIKYMPIIREHLMAFSDVFSILNDSLEITGDDFGLNFSVNGIEVSIHPTIATEKGLVVRQFDTNPFFGEITIKEKLWRDLKEDVETHNVDGININMMPPEYTYLTKMYADRKKDRVDNKVLSRVIRDDKLQKLKDSMIKPVDLLKETLPMDKDNKKKEANNNEERRTEELNNAIDNYQKSVDSTTKSKGRVLTLKPIGTQNGSNNSSNSASTSGGFVNVLSFSTILSIITFIIVLFFIILTVIK